jgi:hypothetical protein
MFYCYRDSGRRPGVSDPLTLARGYRVEARLRLRSITAPIRYRSRNTFQTMRWCYAALNALPSSSVPKPCEGLRWVNT